MQVDTEVVSIWSKLSPKKMIITVVCAMVVFLGWYVRDEIKSLAQIYVKGAETRLISNDKPDDYSLPTKVSKDDQVKIQNVMKEFMRKHNEVGALLMYEFVPRGSQILYQGRVIVTHVSQSGKDLVSRYNSAWLPMNSDKKQVEKLLRGQVFCRPPDKGNISDDDALTKNNFRLMEQDGFTFMVSIPIVDSTLQVRGYLTALMTERPINDASLRDYISRLEHDAVELSQFLI